MQVLIFSHLYSRSKPVTFRTSCDSRSMRPLLSGSAPQEATVQKSANKKAQRRRWRHLSRSHSRQIVTRSSDSPLRYPCKKQTKLELGEGERSLLKPHSEWFTSKRWADILKLAIFLSSYSYTFNSEETQLHAAEDHSIVPLRRTIKGIWRRLRARIY